MNIIKEVLLAIIACCFFFTTVSAQAPNALWVKSIGGTNNDYCVSSAVDVAGNVYSTGWFQGIVDFDPDTGVFNLTSHGNQDIFITKLDSSGNFIWAKNIGGLGNDYSLSIALDISRNCDIYTTGAFSGTVDFDPGSGISNLTAAGTTGVFISKFDSAGNFISAETPDGSGDATGYFITVDPSGSGDVYSTGWYLGTLDFDPGPGINNLTSGGIREVFITKSDRSGNLIWAKAITGTNFSVQNYSMAIDVSGNVYSTGLFSGTVDFNPGPLTFNITSAGGLDIFIFKLDSSGNFSWAKAIGGVGNDYSRSIAIDDSSNLYFTGYFSDTVDFDSGPATFDLFSAGGVDIFVSKFDQYGNFIWAKTIGGSNDDFGLSIALDDSSNVFYVGNFQDTVDFNPDSSASFNMISTGAFDIFISKLDNAGTFKWAKSIGGINSDVGYSIAAGASGNVYVSGYYNSPSILIGPITLTNADNTGTTNDVYIAKLDRMLGVGNIEMENINTRLLLFPNPATNNITIESAKSNLIKIVTITDIAGKIIYTCTAKQNKSVQINTRDFSEGIYIVRIQTTDFIQSKKLIVVK